MMKIVSRSLSAGFFLLALSSQFALAGTIEAVNHTKWAINQFSVNGQSGIDAIGPFQGGGGGCCYSAPAQWQPGMTVRIDWETGVAIADDFPGYENSEKFSAWARKIKAQNRQHYKIVPLPAYTSGRDTCGIVVHFLPCDQVKVTTSCARYGYPDYPIKEPLRMTEPKVCPK